MVSNIEMCFEPLENNQNDLRRVLDELVDGHKKMCSMMEEMWKLM